VHGKVQQTEENLQVWESSQKQGQFEKGIRRTQDVAIKRDTSRVDEARSALGGAVERHPNASTVSPAGDSIGIGSLPAGYREGEKIHPNAPPTRAKNGTTMLAL
jgi:hypothetical protein